MATLHHLPGETPGASRSIGYHGAVDEFRKRLIEATLHQVRGNRTHAARALGLQRTYLLRLMRALGVAAPPPPRRRNGATPPRPMVHAGDGVTPTRGPVEPGP